MERVVIEHPSGFVETRCHLDARTAEGLPSISRASVVTTARPLFTGRVLVRDRLFADAA